MLPATARTAYISCPPRNVCNTSWVLHIIWKRRLIATSSTGFLCEIRMGTEATAFSAVRKSAISSGEAKASFGLRSNSNISESRMMKSQFSVRSRLGTALYAVPKSYISCQNQLILKNCQLWVFKSVFYKARSMGCVFQNWSMTSGRRWNMFILKLIRFILEISIY